jgi:hypothetical protein
LEGKYLNPAHVLFANNRHICRLLVQGCVPQWNLGHTKPYK